MLFKKKKIRMKNAYFFENFLQAFLKFLKELLNVFSRSFLVPREESKRHHLEISKTH